MAGDGGAEAQGRRRVPPELEEQAKAYPGGWVYEIVGEYGPTDAVPPHAIRGAWKVDKTGHVVGDFVENPRFRPPG